MSGDEINKLAEEALQFTDAMPEWSTTRTMLMDRINALRDAALRTEQRPADVPAGWQPMDTAPRKSRLLGLVEGKVRFIAWTKTSHVPLYGWCCVDVGPEDTDLCEPFGWLPLPGAASPTPATAGGDASGASEPNTKVAIAHISPKELEQLKAGRAAFVTPGGADGDTPLYGA